MTDYTCEHVHAFHTTDAPCGAPATYVVHTEFHREATPEEKEKWGTDFMAGGGSVRGTFACVRHVGSVLDRRVTSLPSGQHAHFRAVPVDC
jgi:hypothetical protein